MTTNRRAKQDTRAHSATYKISYKEAARELSSNDDQSPVQHKKYVIPPIPERIAQTAEDAIGIYDSLHIPLGIDAAGDVVALTTAGNCNFVVNGSTGSGRTAFIRGVLETMRAAGWTIAIGGGYEELAGQNNIPFIATDVSKHIDLVRAVASELTQRQRSEDQDDARPPIFLLLKDFPRLVGSIERSGMPGAADAIIEDVRRIAAAGKAQKMHLGLGASSASEMKRFGRDAIPTVIDIDPYSGDNDAGDPYGHIITGGGERHLMVSFFGISPEMEGWSRFKSKVCDQVPKIRQQSHADRDRVRASFPDLQRASDRELDALVGMEEVKARIGELRSAARVRSEMIKRGRFAQPSGNNNVVLAGPPGTGKSSAAGILAKVYFEVGVTKSDRVTTVNRSTLVAGYEGQSSIKARAAIAAAQGGVLVIDDVSGWVRSDADPFGRESMECVVRQILDDPSFVVFLTGYERDLKRFVAAFNLGGQFPTWIGFRNYTAVEIAELIGAFASERGASIAVEKGEIADLIADDHTTKGIGTIEEAGNARYARSVVTAAERSRARRLMNVDLGQLTDAELVQLTREDLAVAVRPHPA